MGTVLSGCPISTTLLRVLREELCDEESSNDVLESSKDVVTEREVLFTDTAYAPSLVFGPVARSKGTR